jgi:hypothetical protein
MKKLSIRTMVYVSVAALLFAGTLNTQAQTGEVGLRFMPTFSALNIKTSDGGTIKGKLTMGYGGGIFLGYHFSDHVGVQGEIIYSAIAQKYKEEDIEREILLRYVNIPLLLSLNTGKTQPFNFTVVAGPQIGFSIGSELSASGGGGSTTGEAVLAVRKGDLGVAYGAGVDFGLNQASTFRMGIGFRGVLGLIDISDTSKNASTQDYYILDKNRMRTYAGYIGVSYLF